ncbi:YggS family pyridoxal phosphate-dependent enzyme [Catenovulum sp. SM1970]|uniref:YggS family pyridoxal phosphate-dependent enzyme n=1 Tax=Marinifaba aquimaris TaxID=2741323 RepID=UPI0015747610|nr:YggS family pyridoxal phosphate-dependent enzyme [Marinifaba aquimaris]NTS78083.1 YggS family pyridoxal phosphate-dependent enzyme [Marinifaba aquimaris]
MNKIAERLEIAQQHITNAATKSQRKTNEIQLLAVSKTKPFEDIEQAYQAGQRQFGENYVQEGVDKVNFFSKYPDIEWHFIGPLQSNKTKLVAEHFDWMQTLSREKIAKRLNEQRSPELAPLNVCIQVNVSQEDSKSGISIEEVLPLASIIAQLPRLNLRGLMAIPEKTDEPAKQAASFAALNTCFCQLKDKYPQVDTLSMGMSQDLEQAIANGSTMVRIGTAIFGARN